MKALKILSLSSYGLRYKLKISFYLMSVLPILICFYLISTYILPTVGIQLNIVVLIAVSVFIAASGFFIVKQIIHPIINISSQAKGIVNGNIDYQIQAERHDEIGEIEKALDKLTARIRDNRRELDTLMQKVKNLEVRDALTGLYNESFIKTRLDEEIKRAIMYQRPCAFIIFSVDRYKELCQDLSLPEIELIFKRIAIILKESITDIDKAARLGEREFALLLPEKNKKQAQNIAEVIKKRIEEIFRAEPDKHKRITISLGVAENPIDGVNTSELISKAKESL
ncbi:MAG: diguanylate cyclase [Candidatus Omnitrophota bacterium]